MRSMELALIHQSLKEIQRVAFPEDQLTVGIYKQYVCFRSLEHLVEIAMDNHNIHMGKMIRRTEKSTIETINLVSQCMSQMHHPELRPHMKEVNKLLAWIISQLDNEISITRPSLFSTSRPLLRIVG